MLFYLHYLVASFMVVLIEGTVFARLAVAGMRPDLSLALVVSSGFTGSARGGVIIGFLLGLIRDAADPERFGLEMLLFSLVGFAAGCTSAMFNRAHPIMRGAMIALLTLAHDLLRFLAVSSFSVPDALLLWLRFSPGSALYTALVAVAAMMALPRLWPMGERRAIS
ncbi:MAG: rod shape-determining protein MreD [Candidatus Eisenbacteria bacterium]